MGILALLCLHLVFSRDQCLDLVVVKFMSLLVILGRRLDDLASVFVGDLQFTNPVLLLLVQCLQLIILLLVGTDSQQQLCVGLLLGHELLDDLPDI